MDQRQARMLWDRFKASPLPMVRWCKANKLDDSGFARTMKRYFAEEWDQVIELKIPRQSPYRYGRALEYQVRDELRTCKYFVMRSPASKSPVDLVALRTGEVLLIQCKRSGKMGVTDWNALYRLAQSVGAKPLLVEKCDSGRGNRYHLLVGEKDGSQRAQPYRDWSPKKTTNASLFVQRS